jgi:hypothetical protein
MAGIDIILPSHTEKKVIWNVQVFWDIAQSLRFRTVQCDIPTQKDQQNANFYINVLI